VIVDTNLHTTKNTYHYSTVTTIFGSGRVVAYRTEDCMYTVELAFGTAFLNSASILGGEQLSPDAISALGISRDGKSIAVGEVSMHVGSGSSKRVNAPCEVFYGTQVCYCFWRLYHTLFVRLAAARGLADDAMSKARAGDASCHPMTKYDKVRVAHTLLLLLSSYA